VCDCVLINADFLAEASVDLQVDQAGRDNRRFIHGLRQRAGP
jgi:hypothetical protein